jgi:hypothetical protein
MLRRRSVLPWLVSAVIVAVCVPAFAWGRPEAEPDPAAAFVVGDNFYANADGTGTSATVPAGSTVSFSYPEGFQFHDVTFGGGASGCVSNPPAGSPAGPIPAFVSQAPWSGECRFDTPGTYTFHCSAHPAMEGTIVVTEGEPTPTPSSSPTVTPTATPTSTATQTPTATPTSAPPPPPPPVPQPSTPPPSATPTPAAPAPTLDRLKATKLSTFAKRGVTVSGSCAPGGSGKVRLTVTKAAAKRLKLKRRTLASGTAKCGSSGRMTAKLKPNAKVRKALKRQRRSLSATLTFTVGAAQDSAKVKLK